MNGKLDLSVTICTLNEQKNIAQCIQSIELQSPSEIIVIDAGSNDNTREIAEELGAEVINCGRKGLAYQRKIGVDKAKYKYIAIIDADQRPEPGCFTQLIDDLEKYNYDGIGAQRINVRSKRYWDWAMEQSFKLAHNTPGPRIIIGTPCIYRAEVIKKIGFDPFFTAPADDTDLSYRMVRSGYKLGMGKSVIREELRSEYKTFRKKLIWYGKGDAQFAWRHPERLLSIVTHELFDYPIKQSFAALKNKKAKVIPFLVLYGLFRHYGFLTEMTKMLLGKRMDRDIHST